MRHIPPTPPADLDPLARATLDRLVTLPAGGHVVIGGGVALKHYVSTRPTVDLDAWWTTVPTAATSAAVRDAVRDVAQAVSLHLVERTWGETSSLDFQDEAGVKRFAFQIATRDVQLEPYRPSTWAPVLLESLVDNVASKMSALVNRGQPRDFIDIKSLADVGAVTVRECWDLWARKHPRAPEASARAQVLQHLTALALRRPLDAIVDPQARAAAHHLRTWYATEFVVRGARVR